MHRQQLEQALLEAEPLIRDLFNTFARLRPVDAACGGWAAPPGTEEALRHQLTNTLYARCYCHDEPGPLMQEGGAAPLGGADPAAAAGYLASLVARALPAWPRPDSGWIVTGLQETPCWAERNGLTLAFSPAELFAPSPGSSAVAVLCSNVRSWQGNQGFNFLCSSRWQPQSTPGIRLYLNVLPRELANAILILAAELEALQLPFLMKYFVHSQWRMRRDNVVLYIALADALVIIHALRAHAPVFASLLAPEVPLFTLPVLPGLACAENQPGGDSFGMTRCSWLAQALCRLWLQGGDYQLRLITTVIEQVFQENGVSLDKPYLNPHSRQELERWI